MFTSYRCCGARAAQVAGLVWSLLMSGACADADSPAAPARPVDAPVPVHAIEITVAAATIERGSTLQLTAITRDAAGAAITGPPVAWSSSAPAIASVDGAGMVRALAPGAATISAAAEGKSADVTLAVRDTAALPATLSGVVERVNLTLPAGRSYRVTGNLTVIADSALTIAGDLLIDPGVSVALFAGSMLTIEGDVGSDTMRIAAGAPAAFATAGAGAAGAPPAELVLGGRGAILVRARPGETRRVHPEGPIYIAGQGNQSLLQIQRANLVPARAEDGTAARRRGADGYAVHIGSSVALQKAEEKFGRPHGRFQRVNIVESEVRGGGGGDGFAVVWREDGARRGNVFDVWTGDGGHGGRLEIVALELDVTGSSVRPGFAGVGGDVELRGEEKLLDGTGPNGEGEGLSAFTGSGGRAGDLTVIVERVINADRFLSARLAPPGAFLIEGGNGADGGRGGELEVRVGRAGPPGTIAVSAGINVIDVGPAVALPSAFRNAANGGNSPSLDRTGGHGGQILVGTHNLLFTPYVPRLDLRNVANGGLGFDGCVVSPRTNGSNGGAGGLRNTGDVPLDEQGRNFIGGNGGNGLAKAGRGGQPGLDQPTSSLIGAKGQDGTLCPIATGRIDGRLLWNGKPVHASLEFSDGSSSTIVQTDALGFFAALGLAHGSYTVRIAEQPAWMSCPSQNVALAAALLTLAISCSTVAFDVAIATCHRHFSGFSEVVASIRAGAALAGVKYFLDVSGPAVDGSGRFEGVLDAEGAATVRATIYAYGLYQSIVRILDRSATASQSVGPGGGCS